VTSGLIDGRVKVWNARTGALIHSYRQPINPGSAYTPAGIRSNIWGWREQPRRQPGGRCRVRRDGGADERGYRNAACETRQPPPGRAKPGVRQSRPAPRDRQPRRSGGHLGTSSPADRCERSQSRRHRRGRRLQPGRLTPRDSGEDTTAKLWDLRTGSATLTAHRPHLCPHPVAFSRDGTRLATASGDGTVRIYVLPLDQTDDGCPSRLTRGWTPTECARYLPGGRCPRNA